VPPDDLLVVWRLRLLLQVLSVLLSCKKLARLDEIGKMRWMERNKSNSLGGVLIFLL
jgi:hypothetical protein